jgi:hypothetical protein
MNANFSRVWRKDKCGKGFTAAAAICLLILLIAPVFALAGGLPPEGMAPHCPQGQSHAAHHNHGTCAWHCGWVEFFFPLDRWKERSLVMAGFTEDLARITPYTALVGSGRIPRGPPISR